MCLVDDDRKTSVPVLAADIVEDEREFLDRGDDDLLAALNEAPQISGMLGMPYRCADLDELPDRVADLLIEDNSVGDDDDRVEDRPAVGGEPDQLVREPSDRVRFARACRVLDQIAPAGAMRRGIGQELADDVELG
jgi:hypothetical protein